MALALQRTLAPASGYPERTLPVGAEPRLNITVVFTNVQSTLSALKKAGTLANKLGSRITLVVPQVVPYPCPLESPPELLDWNERRFHVIAEESAVETAVQLYLCRDRLTTLFSVLGPHSVVVIGGRKRWWPTQESKLARQLCGAGHEVIFAETE